jgi:hypothetical protein
VAIFASVSARLGPERDGEGDERFVKVGGVVHFGSYALACEAMASCPLASGGSQRGIGRAELFAPVTWPYFLAPPDMEVSPSFGTSPPIPGVVSAEVIVPRVGRLDKQSRS